MIISSGAFCTAIDYLAAFGSGTNVVTFSPLGRLVRAAIQTDTAYGEYWLKPVRPLQERFALSLKTLIDFCGELEDDLLEYQPASNAKFVWKSRQWWLDYSPVADCAIPSFNVQQTVRWDNTLSRYLTPLDTAVGETQNSICFDCVLVDQRAQRESLVATNGQIMVAYSRRNKSKMPCPKTLLLKATDVKPFQKLCESQSPIELKLGLTKFSARCGRRFAIFDLRDGRFPRWERWYTQGKRIVLGSTAATGSASTTKNELVKACQSCVPQKSNPATNPTTTISIASRGNGLRFSANDGPNRDQVMMHSQVTNYFGPIKVQSSYLKRIADSWPYQNIQLYYQNASSPIVLSSPESDANLIALIMPVVL